MNEYDKGMQVRALLLYSVLFSPIDLSLFQCEHSSEKRGLCSTKCSRETLQNLLYFWYIYENPHLVFVFQKYGKF